VTGAPIALAVLPVPDVRPSPAGNRDAGTQVWRAELLDLALEAAELPPETRADIATIRLGTLRQPPAQDLVLGVLRGLVARPPSVRPGDPATELSAVRLSLADLLLSLHNSYIPPGFGGPEEDAIADEFNGLGADFGKTEGDATYYYGGALADSAAALPASREGWVGLSGLEDGCSWDPTLEFTEDRLPIVTQPRILARLHYLRAEALTSMLLFQRQQALRPGTVNDVEALRREAFEHYRAALAGGLNDDDEVWAWEMAWSVAMNQPVFARYDCRRA